MDENYYGDIKTFLRIGLVLLSRMGFMLVQIGTIPIQNVYRIVFFNVFEIGLAIISYVTIGYMFTYGEHSLAGILGYTSSPFNITSNITDQIIFGLSGVLLGSAELSCFTIGRIHLVASFIVSLLYCMLYQPMLAHWIDREDGWMRNNTLFDKKVEIKDYAGNMVVHLSSSLMGAIGAAFLGRRLMRLKDLDERSIAREYSALTVIGYLLVLIGYAAFSLPTNQYVRTPDNYIAFIVLNICTAFATGVLLTSLLNIFIARRILNYWSVLRCFQGGIAGVISIAAATDIYNVPRSAGVAAVAALFFFFFAILVHNTLLEDNCNLISSHLVASIVGTIACPIVAKKENLGGREKGTHLLWQFICLLVVLATTIVYSWLLFLLLSCCKLLRNKDEALNHRRAVAVAKYLPRKSCLQRLFMIDSKTDHIAPGDGDRSKYLNEL
ncbi:unnamed protein product [Phyllotreta striolata]|uniref:Ammonium transporter AmtB-like domain-containing protein n=1 Tax=Phyllotreta striolata TaxID=444603 RepID=A0A9N9TGU5_PHYSR|nr:unnamed protein product [Phyllotreta striolata]